MKKGCYEIIITILILFIFNIIILEGKSEKEKYINRQIESYICRQIDKQMDTYIDREGERETGTKRKRKRERERERERLPTIQNIF